MRYIVDRFEDVYAVCENESGNMCNILKNDLPADIKEGDVLAKNNDGTYFIDKEETLKRKKYIEELFKSL